MINCLSLKGENIIKKLVGDDLNWLTEQTNWCWRKVNPTLWRYEEFGPAHHSAPETEEGMER